MCLSLIWCTVCLMSKSEAGKVGFKWLWKCLSLRSPTFANVSTLINGYFLVHLPESEREDYLARGQDIFVQQVCLIKLQLAIGVGIQQENSRVPKDFLVAELDEALGKEEVAVKGEILQELNIELPA